MSDSLWPHGLQDARPPCPSPTPRVYSNSCPLSRWTSDHPILCHPLLLPPSIFPSIKVFSNESVLCIRWSKCWSFSISPSLSVQDWCPLGWDIPGGSDVKESACNVRDPGSIPESGRSSEDGLPDPKSYFPYPRTTYLIGAAINHFLAELHKGPPGRSPVSTLTCFGLFPAQQTVWSCNHPSDHTTFLPKALPPPSTLISLEEKPLFTQRYQGLEHWPSSLPLPLLLDSSPISISLLPPLTFIPPSCFGSLHGLAY